MKVSQFNINIFKSELHVLNKQAIATEKAIDEWLAIQKDRERYGSTDQEWARMARDKLERELIKYRAQLATVYDFMGDRGLVDFVPERDIEDEEVHA